MDGKIIRCLQIVSLHVPIYLLRFLRCSEIFVKNSSFYHTPLAFHVPVIGVPVGISAPPLGQKELESCRYPMVKKFCRYVYSFWRDPRTWQTDGRTDRQTLRDSIDRTCIASRGKNSEHFRTTFNISGISLSGCIYNRYPLWQTWIA